MSAFSYEEFLIFANVKDVDENSYLTVAKGVLEYIKSNYGIYPEVEQVTQNLFLSTSVRLIQPQVAPIISIDSLVYDGNTLVADTDYTFYGDDIELTTALTDVRKPLQVTYNTGYTTVPSDLVLAVYRHIEAVHSAISKQTDVVSKTINTDGNTTYYRDEVVPKASCKVYSYYSGRSLVLV